jgi:D-amino peptidase
MRIYIITDLEGVALINRRSQYVDATPESLACCMALLTGEVNACVEGILDFDDQAEVVVWDGHGSGAIDPLKVHAKAKFIGRGSGGSRRPYFVDHPFDGIMFVGQHAMEGTGSVLCHTYASTRIEYCKINGKEMGEFGCRALMAGTVGIPTVFIAGDDKAVAEAREMIPNIVGAEVKQSLGYELALHLSHQAACELVRNKAREACGRLREIKPFVMDPPFTQELKLKAGHAAKYQEYLDIGFRAIDDRTLAKTTDVIHELSI